MLFNSTTQKKIIGKVRVAADFFGNLKGLMFERQENFDYALIFGLPVETRLGASVHMMFVFFPIDIVFLDAQKKVVDKATLRPWMLNYTPQTAAKYFVEMPLGTGAGTKIGDRVEWVI